MANEYSTKRIINLPSESGPADGDVFVVDNESTGTKKLPLTGLIDPTLSQERKMAGAKATGKAIATAEETLVPVWLVGGTINKTTGAFSETTAAEWRYTYFYPIPDNATGIKLSVYAGGSSAGVAFYDSTATFISGTNVASHANSDLKEYAIPANAKYVRFTNYVGTAYHPDVPLIIFELDKNATIIDSKKDTGYIYSTYRKGVNLNGSYAESNKRMTTIEPIAVNRQVRISLADGWRAWVSYFKNGIWVKDGKQSQYYGYVPEKGYDIYISLGKMDESEISDEELATAAKTIAVMLTTEEETIRRLNQQAPKWISTSMFERIGIMGDSYASGSLHHPDGTGTETNYELSWGQILGRDIGATVTNYSKGGLSTTTWLTNTEYGLAKLLASAPEQLYICAFGINDWAQRETYPIGSIADCKSDYHQNPATFFGSYGKIIGNIADHAPNAKIILLSVMREYERRMDANIKSIAEHFNIPFIKLTNDDFFVSEYYANSIYDGHPVAYGYSGIAEAIKRLICKCVMDYTEYFGTYYG